MPVATLFLRPDGLSNLLRLSYSGAATREYSMTDPRSQLAVHSRRFKSQDWMVLVASSMLRVGLDSDELHTRRAACRTKDLAAEQLTFFHTDLEAVSLSEIK